MGKISKNAKKKKTGVKWKGEKDLAPEQRMKGQRDRLNLLRLERFIERESSSLTNWVPPPPPKVEQPSRIDEDGFVHYKRKARSGPEDWILRGAARPWESLDDGTLDPNGRAYDIIPDGKNMFKESIGNFWFDNNDSRNHIYHIKGAGKLYKILNKFDEHILMHVKALELDYSDSNDNIDNSSSIVLTHYLFGYSLSNSSSNLNSLKKTSSNNTSSSNLKTNNILKKNNIKDSIIINKTTNKNKKNTTSSSIGSSLDSFLKIDVALRNRILKAIIHASSISTNASFCLLLISLLLNRQQNEKEEEDQKTSEENLKIFKDTIQKNDDLMTILNIHTCINIVNKTNRFIVYFLLNFNLFQEVCHATKSIQNLNSDISGWKQEGNNQRDDDGETSHLNTLDQSATSESPSSSSFPNLETNVKGDWRLALNILLYWNHENNFWNEIYNDFQSDIINMIQHHNEDGYHGSTPFSMEGIPDIHFPIARRFKSACKKCINVSKS